MKFFSQLKLLLSNYLIQKNLPSSLLVVYIMFCLYEKPNYPDAIISIFLILLFGFKLYLDHIQKPDLNSKVLEELEQLKTQVHNFSLIKNPNNKSENYNWFNK